MHRKLETIVTRRRVVIAGGAIAGGLALASAREIDPARATPASLRAAIDAVVGSADVRDGRVTLEVPPLVENGNTVPITVSVASAMTDADHVTAIHVFNEKNPQPHVVDIRLGPRAGRASLSTRIRLSDSQKVVAIARMSDGSFWSASADVVVTLAACVEGQP